VNTARLATRIAALAAPLVLVLVAAGVRLASEARSNLASSDEAWQKGDAAAATVHARSAARAYVPGSEHMARGYGRLREIAESSERRGDSGAALFAWRAVLAAATESRPFSSCGETCDVARTSIVRLAAAEGKGRATSGDRRTNAVERSAADVVPSAQWGALIVVSAALLLTAGSRLGRAYGQNGILVRREVQSAAAIGVAGIAIWIVGMLFA
jgi:hypothetical protein